MKLKHWKPVTSNNSPHSSNNSISHEHWAGIHYALMLLSLLLFFVILIPLFNTVRLLNGHQDVWIRSHHLWVMRSCAGFVLFIVLSGLLAVPLFWLPYQQGAGFVVLMVACATAAFGWLWLLYRSIKGLHAFVKGKAVY